MGWKDAGYPVELAESERPSEGLSRGLPETRGLRTLEKELAESERPSEGLSRGLPEARGLRTLENEVKR